MNWIILPIVIVGALLLYSRKGYSTSERKKGGKNVISPEEQFSDLMASNDPETLLSALPKTNDVIARHQLYHRIIDLTYSKRGEQKEGEIFFSCARDYVAEFSQMKPALEEHYEGDLPEIPAFKKLAIALEEIGAFDEALDVCKAGIENELEDGTKTGFSGRMQRIDRKREKTVNSSE